MGELKIPHLETIKKTAEIFGLHEYFVRQKVINGEVVAVRAGRKWLVNIERFADYLNGDNGGTNHAAENTGNDERIQPIPLRLR